MTEDAKAAGEEPVFSFVARHVLDFQELDDGLRHRQPSRHGFPYSGREDLRPRALALRPLTRGRNQNSVYSRRHAERCAAIKDNAILGEVPTDFSQTSKSLRCPAISGKVYQ